MRPACRAPPGSPRRAQRQSGGSRQRGSGDACGEASEGLLLPAVGPRPSSLTPAASPVACRVAAADSDLTQEELEEQLEAFMRRQAEIESGATARKVEPGKVLGADEVSDEVRCWQGWWGGGKHVQGVCCVAGQALCLRE